MHTALVRFRRRATTVSGSLGPRFVMILLQASILSTASKGCLRRIRGFGEAPPTSTQPPPPNRRAGLPLRASAAFRKIISQSKDP